MITSVGTDYFSSGLDLNEMMSLPLRRRREPFEALIDVYRDILACPKPTLAALTGSALLGGWVLAMACDWRVIASDSKIALSEIRAGLSPTPLLLKRLDFLCSDRRVFKNMVLRGQTIRAEEAFGACLVDEVVPHTDVMSHAERQSLKLARLSPFAYAAIKRSINKPFLDTRLWRTSLTEFRSLFKTKSAQEGISALRDKRRPLWDVL
jgi:enoyl-CoA hydratase